MEMQFRIIQSFKWLTGILMMVMFYSIPIYGQIHDVINEPLRDGDLPVDWTETNIEFKIFALFNEGNSILTSPVLDLTGLENIQLTFSVGQYTSGTGEGPITVEISDDGGTTWNSQIFESPTPTSTDYIISGPTDITAGGNEVQIRFTRINSTKSLRIRDVILTAIGDPTILAEPDAIAGLSYDKGFGPSTSQSFSITGSLLEPDAGEISVTSTGAVEISQDNSTFSAEESISYIDGSTEEILYVRLKAGLDAQLYNEEINLSGGGVDKSISVSGFVDPVLTTDGYKENFSEFVSMETLPTGWTVSDDTYLDEWGAGSDRGLRGNAEVLGYQHRGTIRSITAMLTLKNSTGSTIENLNVSYSGRVERVDDLSRKPFWTVKIDGDEAEALSYSTSLGVDSWVQESITGISIAEGETFEIIWTSTASLGTDEHNRQIGIGEVSVSAFDGDPIYETHLTGNEGFRMISAPTATSYQELLEPLWTQGMANASTDTDDSNVWTWDKNSAGGVRTNWNALGDLSEPLDAGSSFLIYVYENDDGAEGSGEFPKTLTVSGEEQELPVTFEANVNSGGFSLLGNPTGSALSWNNMTKNDLDDVVYVWDANEDAWNTWSGNVGAGDLTDGIIRPYQGFLTITGEDAGNSSLEISEEAITKGGIFHGKQAAQDKPLVMRLQLDGDNLSDSAWLSFSENGSMTKDSGDALKLQPLSAEYAMLATTNLNGTLLDINHLPILDKSLEVPLVANVTQSGNFTLSASQINLPQDWNVMLTDNLTGDMVEIDSLMTYNFDTGTTAKKNSDPKALISGGRLKTTTADISNRFILTINTSRVTDMESPSSLPKKLALRQNFPNPFNPNTQIGYEMPENAFVSLTVYDLLGREIAILVSENKPAGFHQANWDARAATSGIYVYRLEANNRVLTGKMTLIK